MSSAIGNIQQQAADALSADPFFANITVFTEQVGGIIDAMMKALGGISEDGGKVGAFVCVMSPDANVNYPELAGPFFDEVPIHVQVTTNIPVAADPDCGIGVTDLEICENVCRVLSTQFLAGSTSPLSAEKPTIQLKARSDDETTRLCCFRTSATIAADLTQVATPVISENAGVITITCSTPGAAIFYTTNGKNAIPRVGTFYTGPFTPGSGLKLKVRAWLAGYLASETVIQTT